MLCYILANRIQNHIKKYNDQMKFIPEHKIDSTLGNLLIHHANRYWGETP